MACPGDCRLPSGIQQSTFGVTERAFSDLVPIRLHLILWPTGGPGLQRAVDRRGLPADDGRHHGYVQRQRPTGPRVGARPLLSRITEHSHYVTGLLGPTMVAGAGLGML
jgi:hypothetical protein